MKTLIALLVFLVVYYTLRLALLPFVIAKRFIDLVSINDDGDDE